MESELTEASEKTPQNDNLAVTEEVNVNEAITAESKASNKTEIGIQRGLKTKSYKKMNIDIEKLTYLKIEKSIYNSMEDNLQSYIRSLFHRI